ncbi:hypothetical protein K440DRAFT_558938, partial [Wilcoxina mikolae CBS 423.85]
MQREQQGQKSSKLTLQESEEPLIKITDIHPRTTICIDALDEVEQIIDLLRSLKLIIDKSKNLVRIFATSRNDPDILKQFHMFPKINVGPEDNEGDMNSFIRSQIKRAVKYSRLLDDNTGTMLQDEICNVLSTRAKGLFQLAAVHIPVLCELHTEVDIRSSLHHLPMTLREAYDTLYSQI